MSEAKDIKAGEAVWDFRTRCEPLPGEVGRRLFRLTVTGNQTGEEVTIETANPTLALVRLIGAPCWPPAGNREGRERDGLRLVGTEAER
jgi:hypothetical protein